MKYPPPEAMKVNAYGMEIPDQYYSDGGQVYWLFGGILFVAPISNTDTILWDDAGEVDFYMIDPELAAHAKAVEKALGELEAAYVDLREWMFRAENPTGVKPA